MDVVCGQMKPDLASKIIDCARVVVKTEPIPMSPQTRSEDLARKFGGTPVTALAQRVRAAYPSAYDDLSDKELEDRVRAKYPDIDNADPRRRLEPWRVDVLGQLIRLPVGLSEDAVNRASAEYARALNVSLASERRQAVGWAVAWWFVPMAFLYGFGSSVAWVRRGFRRHS